MLRFLMTLVLAAFAFAAQASVDVNKASQAELQTIKGIGPSLSAKIVDARKAGDFKNWSDMVERVSGVGPGNAARFSQAGLTVGSAGYSAQAVTAHPTSAKSGAKAQAIDTPTPKMPAAH